MEVSALMDLKVDELLVGIINQIRLHKNKDTEAKDTRNSSQDGRRSPLALIGRLLRRQGNVVTQSCDNMLVL